MTSTYVTHARSLQELRDEFVSDINRRLSVLDAIAKYEKQASKSLAIARAKMELEDMLKFWLKIELRGSKRSKGEIAS